MKNVLIVGANFQNKGAQSMLFVTTDEVKKRYPECNVYFGCNNEEYNENNYTFKKVKYTLQTQNYALGSAKYIVIQYCKDIIKFLIGKRYNLWGYTDLKKLFKNLDLVIDISGYALADFSSDIEHEYYLNAIRLARKNNVPIVLMPQSFGPFNYSEKRTDLLKEIKDLISYSKYIFAREEEGKKRLEEYLGVNYAILSPDLVLQNVSLNLNNIFLNKPTVKNIELNSSKNIAIIPNYHCFEDGNKKHCLEIYNTVTKSLTERGYNIYIFRHSTFDLNVCRMIYDNCKNYKKVYLIETEFSCLEFDNYVRHFDFVICSRFHGCVHSYKNNIPCIILGWAIKYRELARTLRQDKYVFNIKSTETQDKDVKTATINLIENLSKEKHIIAEQLAAIQANNCFDIVLKD